MRPTGVTTAWGQRSAGKEEWVLREGSEVTLGTRQPFSKPHGISAGKGVWWWDAVCVCMYVCAYVCMA